MDGCNYSREIKKRSVIKKWLQMFPGLNILLDTGRKLNVHRTFRIREGRLLSVLCTLNLRAVSMG